MRLHVIWCDYKQLASQLHQFIHIYTRVGHNAAGAALSLPLLLMFPLLHHNQNHPCIKLAALLLPLACGDDGAGVRVDYISQGTSAARYCFKQFVRHSIRLLHIFFFSSARPSWSTAYCLFTASSRAMHAWQLQSRARTPYQQTGPKIPRLRSGWMAQQQNYERSTLGWLIKRDTAMRFNEICWNKWKFSSFLFYFIFLGECARSESVIETYSFAPLYVYCAKKKNFGAWFIDKKLE